MIPQPFPPEPRDPARALTALRLRDDLLAPPYWLHGECLKAVLRATGSSRR